MIDFEFANKFDEKTTTFFEKNPKNYSHTYMINKILLKIFFKKSLISDIKIAIKKKRYVNIKYFSDKEFL